MVALKNSIILGLLVGFASAANVHNNKRHVHHRRNKAPCSTTASVPYPANGNSTQPAGTGMSSSTEIAASTTNTGISSVPSVVTVSVVPVPVSQSTTPETSGTVLPTSQPIESSPAGSSPAGGAAPSTPVGSTCGVATSYVTVQQTVTVTAGQAAATTSSTSTTSTTTTSSSSSTPIVVVPLTSASSSPAVAVESAPVPISSTPVSTSVRQSAAALLQTGSSSSASSAPAASSITSTPTTSKPVAGGSYNGKKMGTSWNPGQTWLFSSLGINVGNSWVYDWGQAPHGVPSSVPYVPTLHDQSQCATFASVVEAQTGVEYLKHFNEPDNTGGGGSSLSPAAAASLHNQYIAPLGSKYQLGFPAITSNNIPGTSGTGWLTSFVDIVGCDDFSFADMHFYGASESTEEQAEIFMGYVTNWINTVDNLCPGKDMPIWITEFSAGPTLGDVAQAATFMGIVGPQLDSMPRVARYAYFFPQNNQLSGALAAIDAALGA